jgi:hypothetical protein
MVLLYSQHLATARTTTTSKVRVVESEPNTAPLSKRQQVAQLALTQSLSESTIWRRVKQGLITLEDS